MGMFNTDNKNNHEKIQKRFARDLMCRCSAEFTAALKKNSSSVDGLIRDLSYAIIECYGGNCVLCHKYSFNCHGNSAKHYLPKESRVLLLTADYRTTLRTCISLRLVPKAIRNTKFGLSTN